MIDPRMQTLTFPVGKTSTLPPCAEETATEYTSPLFKRSPGERRKSLGISGDSPTDGNYRSQDQQRRAPRAPPGRESAITARPPWLFVLGLNLAATR